MLIRAAALTLALAAVSFSPLTDAPAQPPAPAPSSSPQAPATPAPAALSVRGPGLKDLDLTLADLKAMPRRTLVVKDRDDKPVTYSGVAVEDILSKAGMVFGQALRGPKLRDYLLAEASNAYAVVFALPEISTEFSDRLVIVADTLDNNPLPEKEGPLKIIVSDEKKHARWVRNLTSLTLHTCEPAPK